MAATRFERRRRPRRLSGPRTFLTELVVHRFSSRELTADRRIGKYIIADIIGRGGNNIVYEDEDQQALKRLLEEFPRKLSEAGVSWRSSDFDDR